MYIYTYIYTYIYIYPNHSAAYLKLIQYCKSTLLQFKKKEGTGRDYGEAGKPKAWMIIPF